MIKQHYIVTKDTCALLPAKHIEYNTIVIGKETTHISQTPFEIIQASCIHHWSSYEGRRKAVVEKLNYRQKTPIPVSVQHKLCFFPTHAPTHMDNCWINWFQVDTWREIHNKDGIHNEQTEILFLNGYRLKLNISRHTMLQQMDRVFAVIYESGMVSRTY